MQNSKQLRTVCSHWIRYCVADQKLQTNVFRQLSELINHPKTIYSGIQPTGQLHLGNYLGAVRHWIDLQNKQAAEQIIFCIVDLHAITVPQNPTRLWSNVRTLTAELIGCGIDPKRCLLYCQSSVPEHAELCWILSTLITYNRLRHQPQFKDKVEDGDTAYLGLLTYPVLQSADILLFHGTHVPVGSDQIAHLQITNNLSDAFNESFKPGFFPKVQPLIGDFPKVKSLSTPIKKMSKSEINELSRINIADSDDLIASKIKKAVTDSIRANSYEPDARPGVANLIDLFAWFSGLSREQALSQCARMDGKGPLKIALTECLIEHIRPLRQRTEHLLQDKDYLDSVLSDGAREARQIARKTMKDVGQLVGLRRLVGD